MSRPIASRAVAVRLLAGVTLLGAFGCKKDPDPIKETAPPPAISQQKVAAGQQRFVIGPLGKTTIDIDAPLERFKGETTMMSGEFRIDLANLKSSIGEVDADLEGLRTFTFGDDKDKDQTEHAHNWFEIGDEGKDSVKNTDPQKFADYKLAHFYIDQIDETSVPALKDAPLKDGARVVTFKATDRLRVHGRDAKKTVRVEVTFVGPVEAPTELKFKTLEPVIASLSEHDVKPRDAAGKFLDGTLKAVGKKLDDKAQVQVEGTAKPAADK
ncbi:MAG: hypothetical protein ABI175_29865 [Polyangiales bacterium]